MCQQTRRLSSGWIALPVVACFLFVTDHACLAWAQPSKRQAGLRPQAAKRLEALQQKATHFRQEGNWPKAVGALNELSKNSRKAGLVDVAFNAEIQVLEIAGICGDKPSTPDNWIRKSTQDALSLVGNSTTGRKRLEKKLEELRTAIQTLTEGRSPELCEDNLATIEEALGTLNGIQNAHEITLAANRSKSEFRANLIEHIMKTSGVKGVALYDLLGRNASLVARLNHDNAVISDEARLKVKRYVANLAEINQPRSDYYQIAKHADDVMKMIDRDPGTHRRFCQYFASKLLDVIQQHNADGELSLAQNYALPALMLAKTAYADDLETHVRWLKRFTDVSDNLLGWETAATDLLSKLQRTHANSDERVIAAAIQLIKWKKVRGKFDVEQCQEVKSWIAKAGPKAEKHALDCEVFLCDYYVEQGNIEESRRRLKTAGELAARFAPEHLAELQYRAALLELSSGQRDRARKLFQQIVASARSPYKYCQAESALWLAKLQSRNGDETSQACDSMLLAIKMFDDVYAAHSELLRVKAIYRDGDGRLQQTVDPMAEAEVKAHIDRHTTLASWLAEIASQQVTATLLDCLQFIHHAQRLFEKEEHVRQSSTFSFLVERHHSVLRSILSSTDGQVADLVQRELAAELEVVKTQVENLRRTQRFEREMAVGDAQNAVREYQQRMMNSPSGVWGMIRFIEVNTAGLPTGRIK